MKVASEIPASAPTDNQPEPPRFCPPLVTPLLVLLVVSMAVRWLDLDLQWAEMFWMPSGEWQGDRWTWVRFFYRFGEWPAILAASGAASVLVLSCWQGPWRRWRRVAAFVVLLAALGPGLAVNQVFKEHFARPRPRDLKLFGGGDEFLPLGAVRWGGPGRSFPSGHAAMGFFWLGLAAFYSRQKPPAARTFLGVGFAHGFVMGAARMAVGAHWLSDVVWSAGIVYLTAWFLCRVVPPFGTN